MTRQKKRASVWELQDYLGTGGKVLRALGYDEIPTDHNPVWLGLAGMTPADEEQVEAMVDAGEMTAEEAEAFLDASERGQELAEKLRPILWRGKGPNKGAILRAYVLCQTACLNSVLGPIGTGDLATIRQRWYFSKLPAAMGFKFAAQLLETEFIKSADVVLVDDQRAHDRAKDKGATFVVFKSQWSKFDASNLTAELGRPVRTHTWPKSSWGRAYAQQQSGILGDLVREGLTYEELWVRDASRDVDRNEPLVEGFTAALLLEKQGLFDHFKQFCSRAGIPVLAAMSGNNAFSMVEATLNDSFRNWEGQYTPTEENPLFLFVISDHDYYGHVPVQEGAAEQFRRYLPDAVKVVRVGVTPDQLRDLGRSPVQAGYEFDAEYNTATSEWAEVDGVWVGDTCYAIEVEALEPSQYVSYLIDALVEALGGDEELRKRLAEMAEPDWWQAKDRIENRTYKLSELWCRLEAMAEWSEEQRADAERPIDSWVNEVMGPEYDVLAWRNKQEVKEAVAEAIAGQSDAMDVGKFAEHVQGDNWGKWQPVGSEQATQAVVDLFVGEYSREMFETSRDVDWENDLLMAALKRVFDLLKDFGLEL